MFKVIKSEILSLSLRLNLIHGQLQPQGAPQPPEIPVHLNTNTGR